MKSIAITLFGILFLFCSKLHAQQGSDLLIKANRASLNKEYTKAMELYSQYIHINTQDFRGYFNRGTSAYNAEKYPQAIQDFSKTLSLNPIFMEAYYFRGLSYYHLKVYNKAIEDYTQGLAKKPNNPAFLKLRAEALSSMGENDQALNDLNQAISSDKLAGDLYKRRAELKVKMKDINGAIKDYNAVEKLMPTYKMVHYIKGKLFLEIQEIDFACEEFEQALGHKIFVADRLNQLHCIQD